MLTGRIFGERIIRHDVDPLDRRLGVEEVKLELVKGKPVMPPATTTARYFGKELHV